MARPKGAKNKKKTNHVFQDPQVEEIVEEWVEYTCPTRGKVRQKVKIKKLKKVNTEPKVFMGARDIIEDLESKEDSLSEVELDPEE